MLTLRKLAPTYYLTYFFQKLNENEEILAQRGASLASIHHCLTLFVLCKPTFSTTKLWLLLQVTGASIQVASEMLPNSTERTVTISGSADSITQCIFHICCVMLEVRSLLLSGARPSFEFVTCISYMSGSGMSHF